MFLTTKHLKIYKIFSLALVFSLSAVGRGSAAQCVHVPGPGFNSLISKGAKFRNKARFCMSCWCLQTKHVENGGSGITSLRHPWSPRPVSISCAKPHASFYSAISLFPMLLESVTYLLLILEIWGQ